MADVDTPNEPSTGTALVVTRPEDMPKPSMARGAASPDFISQMLAARQHLPPQRARRRAPVNRALEAYAEGRTRGQPRLPPGFFSTRLI